MSAGLETQLSSITASHLVDTAAVYFPSPTLEKKTPILSWRLFSPVVMRTEQPLSHCSGMDVNVAGLPHAQDPGPHVWTNEPSIIFPPDWKKINFSWFVVLFLIADVCSVLQHRSELGGSLRGKCRMSGWPSAGAHSRGSTRAPSPTS